MQRVVTVWCPEWPVVAAGMPDEVPAVVIRANRVSARTPAAIAAGVLMGQRRRSAQRTCSELVLVEDDPERDARRFEAVVGAVSEMAPRVEVVEAGWLRLDARGPSRYFGGDDGCAERLGRVVAACVNGDDRPVAVGIGIADGRVASALAARRAALRPSGRLVVPPGRSLDFVAPLPVGMLGDLGEIAPELADLFGRLGLTTLGELAALDAHDVLARFGREGIRAHDIALAVDDRPVVAVDPAPEWWVDHVFAEPVDRLETVVFVAKRLADQLAAQLSAEGRVCVRLVVTIETEHGDRSERVWYRSGGMSASAMVDRVRWQLDGWTDRRDGVSGGVALVRLAPDEVLADDGEQIGFWGGRSRADHRAERAIVRLAAISGDDRVRVPQWSGGRLPGERYLMVPATATDLADSSGRLERDGGPWPGSVPSPAPAVVPARPIPVGVFDAEGRQIGVNGRGEVNGEPAVLVVGSRRERVQAWAGPWPIEQRWWSPDRARRLARFQLVVDGGDAHLVAVERQEWSILATYG